MYAWYNALLCGIYATLLIVVILFVLSFFFRNGRWAYILSNMKLCYSPFLIFLMVLFAFIIMINTFNNGKLFIGTHTEIPVDISKWGDFATFFGGIFALISIYLAYRAFISQANSSKRSSFDATFTQIFAQHKALHDKAANHKIYIGIWNKITRNIFNESHNVFTLCKNEYNRSHESVQDFWRRFNRIIGLKASVDFRNYFKYIYHEVNIVVSQPDEVLDEDAKRNYIQLIQAQMNYDELFCYLVNQVEYLHRFEGDRRDSEMGRSAYEHARNLLRYGFFRELCNGGLEYANLVRRIIGTDRNGRINDNNFIDDDWFLH